MNGPMEWDLPTTLPALPPVVLPAPTFPDAKLLGVCALLEMQQQEWQRLWEAAGRPNESTVLLAPDDPLYAEQEALVAFTRKVWPATDDPHMHLGEVRTDVAAQLLSLAATTPRGLQAKAAAVLALVEVAGWTECRDDLWYLKRSVLADAAGAARIPVGDGT